MSEGRYVNEEMLMAELDDETLPLKTNQRDVNLNEEVKFNKN